MPAKRTRFGELWALFEFWKDGTAGHMNVINALIDPIISSAIERKKANASWPEKKEIVDYTDGKRGKQFEYI